ncbi:MAG: CPXCG motif-containing cysteine-rich protein [Elusimicrobiota bacterium]
MREDRGPAPRVRRARPRRHAGHRRGARPLKGLQSIELSCPYCGETIELAVEPLPSLQRYIEDCSVCCHPLQLEVTPGDPPSVSASRA